MATVNPIRRALELPLVTACAGVVAPAFDPVTQIWWPNMPFNPSALAEYARFTFHEMDTNPRTLGRNPRIEKTGSIILGVHVRAGVGADRADEITGKQGTADGAVAGSGLLTAYPYAAALAKDGVSVKIDVAKSGGDPVEIDGWWYKPTSVYWNVWRAT